MLKDIVNFIFISVFITLFLSCQNNSNNLNNGINLNKDWKFRQVGTEKWYPAKVPGCVHTDLFNNNLIEAPFYRINEKSLQWIDKVDWEYKTNFVIDDETYGDSHIELNFKGFDTYADVYLNDTLIVKANNMFREWVVDCKNQMINGKNELRIYFHSPINIGLQKLKENGYPLPAVNDQSDNGGLENKRISPFTRKAPYHYGWDWGPRFVTSGIWKPIEINSWNKAQINNIQIIQNQLSDKKAILTSNYEIKSDSIYKAKIKISGNGIDLMWNEIELKPGMNNISVEFSIKNPKYWWTNGLGEQFLYHIISELLIDNESIDSKSESIGLRTVQIVRNKDSLGTSFYVELNGIPVFMKGVNYIPNDNFLDRVTPEEYEYIIKSAADANMNMIRVWGGGIYEKDIFYNLCDKYGILVWQDFMFACSMYPGDDEFFKNVEIEAVQNIKRLRNHPCIALWCGNNEIDAAWGQNQEDWGWGWKKEYNKDQRKEIWSAYDTLFHKMLPSIVNEFDKSRFYWPSSPLADFGKHAYYESKEGDIHYWGVWHGKEPFENFEKYIGRFISEYGFQSFPDFKTIQKYTNEEDWNIESEVMMSHQRSGIGNLTIKEYMGWYYKLPTDFKSFLYLGQVLQAEGIKMAIEAHRRNMPICMGSLYWQLNDCWPVASWSSIDYYGHWKALHYFVKKAYNDILTSANIENGKLKIFIVSDKLEAIDSKLELNLMDFNGTSLWSIDKSITILPNQSKTYYEININQILKKQEKNKAFLYISLTENGEIISENFKYFDKIKNIKLPIPSIKKKISDHGDYYEIELTTNKLAKNVYLWMDHSDGFFNDNYFDLLPGKTKKIKFYDKISPEDLMDNLKIITLADIYNN